MERQTKQDLYERSVAGTLLLYPEMFYVVADTINPEMFLNKAASAIIEGVSNRDTVTAISAKIRLLGEIPLDFTSHKNRKDLESNSVYLKKKYCRRFELKLAHQLEKRLLSQEVAEEIHSDIQGQRDMFYEAFIEKDDKLRVITEVKDLIMNAADSDTGITGIESGIQVINEIRGGNQGGDYILIGARPGQGKTSIVIKETFDVMSRGGRIAFVSLEMPKRQIVQKWASYKTRVGVDRMNSGDCGSKLDDVLRTCDEIFEMDYVIENSYNLDTLVARLRAAHYKKKLDLVVIDYIQLIRCGQPNANSSLTEISSQLKRLAIEFDCTFYVLSQLNRDVEKQRVQRPNMSNLRDSGSLEADADLIFFLFNAAYYKHETMTLFNDKGDEYDTENKVEFLCDKNRHGKKKSMLYDFNGNFPLPNADLQLPEDNSMPRLEMRDLPF